MSTTYLLAIDAGSSSIRCTAYQLNDETNHDNTTASLTTTTTAKSSLLQSTPFHHSIPLSTITSTSIQVHPILTAIDECIDMVLSLLRDSSSDDDAGYRIASVGFSTFVMNFIGVDMNGDVVEDVACWYGCNSREVGMECERLRCELTNQELSTLYQDTGAPIHSAYALPQLLALYKNNDEMNQRNILRVCKWQTISSICIQRWMGGGVDVPISFSEASWTGMLNYQTCTWNETILQLLNECVEIKSAGGSTNLLPDLVDFDGTTIQGETTSLLMDGVPQRCRGGETNPYWDRWPELRGRSSDDAGHKKQKQQQHCRLFLGIGDGAAANCGSKCDAFSTSSGQRIAVTIGTSAAARICLPLSINSAPIDVPPGLFCYRVDRHRVLVGGALTDGGSVVEWVRNLFHLQTPSDFEAALEEASRQYSDTITMESSTQSLDVTMIPFLSGERSTGFRSLASGCIAGITRDTTTVDILRGSLEGVTSRLGVVIGLISDTCNSLRGSDNASVTGDAVRQLILVASGGALERNSLWRQMIADCTGLTVVLDGDSNEGTSRGVGLLMARIMKQTEQSKEELSVVGESRPNRDAESRWKRAMQDQETLISAVSQTW